MLNLNVSNRFEVLLKALLEKLALTNASVFDAEQIIVPSAAVKRYLAMAIADVFGVCAHVEFSFLAQWLWRQIARVMPVSETSPFASDVLSWRILRWLENPAFTVSHPRITTYLSRCDEVMRYDLACRIASLFEQYALYRPEWLSAWAKGEKVAIVPPGHKKQQSAEDDQAWQSQLWQCIARETGTLEQSPVERFFALLESGEEKGISPLPERIHLFCEPAIAPQHLNRLRQLGKWIDIELYVLNPCREYWFDLVDSRRLAWLARRQKDLYYETGNNLLASWGKQSQASIEALMLQLEPFAKENDQFVPYTGPDGNETLLSHLQNAILDLTELQPGSLSHLSEDESLEIHVAHSLTREIEILHDQLLRRFALDKALSPGRILVVTPDLENASPLIDAVFGHSDSAPAVPYVITGRRDNRINPVSRALLDVLTLASSRFSASGVVDVLMQPVVGASFGFGNDLKRIRDWLNDAGICWGLDGPHKSEFGLPGEDGHSFHDGLHRLFLAYALPDHERLPFAGRLPVGSPSGSDAVELGQLWRFIEAIRDLKQRLSRPKTADGWKQTWYDVLTTFTTLSAETIDFDREVRTCIADGYGNMAEADAGFEISFPIARQALERALEGTGQGSVPAGAVTFAPMDRLRNLPFDHLYLVGLDNDRFPADVSVHEFDLISLFPRKNDRNSRVTDRNVFLDLILSARKSLYISYTGKSIRDNSVRPPSILVTELLDACVTALANGTGEAAREVARRRLVTEHPLQPFSPRYFDGRSGKHLVSFRTDLCEALQRRFERNGLPAKRDNPLGTGDFDDEAETGDDFFDRGTSPFFIDRLSPPDTAWQAVGLSELIRFFHHPCRYLMRYRLGLDFPRREEALPVAEPFVVDRAARRRLAERLLPLYLEGVSQDDIEAAAMAGNEFPAGRIGHDLLHSEMMELAAFTQGLSAALGSRPVPPLVRTLSFDLDGEVWTLTGSLTGLTENGLLRYRFDEASARNCLADWIEHLFLNACAPESVSRYSLWYYRNGQTVVKPYEGALTALHDLLGIYREGLVKPLPFFPNSAWEYVRSHGQIGKAREKWTSWKNGAWGEANDPFNRLATRGVDDPLDARFTALAERVFGPLFAHLEEESHETGA